jgi:hypothetical protein
MLCSLALLLLVPWSTLETKRFVIVFMNNKALSSGWFVRPGRPGLWDMLSGMASACLVMTGPAGRPIASARPADFSVAKHFHAAKRLALEIVPRRQKSWRDRRGGRGADQAIRAIRVGSALHLLLAVVQSDVSHTQTALNCLLCCCLFRAFLLILLVYCILPATFCTLQCATQGLQTPYCEENIHASSS